MHKDVSRQSKNSIIIYSHKNTKVYGSGIFHLKVTSYPGGRNSPDSLIKREWFCASRSEGVQTPCLNVGSISCSSLRYRPYRRRSYPHHSIIPSPHHSLFKRFHIPLLNIHMRRNPHRLTPTGYENVVRS